MIRYCKCPDLLFSGLVSRYLIVLRLDCDSGRCCLYYLWAQHGCHHDYCQKGNDDPFQVIISCFFFYCSLHVFLLLLFLFFFHFYLFLFSASHCSIVLFYRLFLSSLRVALFSCYLLSSGFSHPGYGIHDPHKLPDDRHVLP